MEGVTIMLTTEKIDAKLDELEIFGRERRLYKEFIKDYLESEEAIEDLQTMVSWVMYLN